MAAHKSPNFTDEEVPDEVAAALVDPPWAASRLEAWGKDSPVYASRVLGQFPRESEFTLISQVDADAAIEAYLEESIKPDKGDCEMGVDVARKAMVDIRARLAAVKMGKITPNHEEDAKTFDRNGVGAYALEASPLVTLFTVPAGGEVS